MRYLLFVVAGCGFSAHPAAATSDAPHTSDGEVLADGPRPIDASFDAPHAEPFMLACSGSTLYTVDVTAKTATLVGPITAGATTFSIFGLAGTSQALYGIPSTLDTLLTIDPASGMVTASRAIAKHDFYGFAWAEGTWYAGTDNTGETANVAHLYTIDPASGTETVVGAFGSGLTVAGDLAYVHQRGLYGTFYGPGCNPTCIASVNPSSGAANVLTYTGPSNVLSLSGFGGRLWGLSNDGTVYEFDPSNGATLGSFDTLVAWADAAN